MKLNEVRKLDNGDEVTWTDPDDSFGSRIITIQAIRINAPDDNTAFGDEIISITAKDGSELECYAHELS
jgi:hypothetical protein